MTQCENSLELELVLPHNQGWCDQKSCISESEVNHHVLELIADVTNLIAHSGLW